MFIMKLKVKDRTESKGTLNASLSMEKMLNRDFMTEKGKDGKRLQSSCENYPFEDYHWKSGIPI